MQSDFGLLKNKAIIAILDGDTQFDKILRTGSWPNEIIVAMPYLSGPDLCSLSKRFGLPQDYDWNGGNRSRWEYFSDLLSHCIKKGTVSNLLAYLFSKTQFEDRLRGLPASEVDEIYHKIVERAIDAINGELYFGGNELIALGGQYVIRPIGQKIVIEAPKIRAIDRGYIKDITERASDDIDSRHYDSAITKSRTLLEEVFCYVIEKKGEVPVDNGKINDLYGQVKKLYNMHQSKDVDKRINDLLSGLNKIVDSISQMRNESSDSHGVGAKRINIAEHHARLFVNAATTVADFVLSVANK